MTTKCELCQKEITGGELSKTVGDKLITPLCPACFKLCSENPNQILVEYPHMFDSLAESKKTMSLKIRKFIAVLVLVACVAVAIAAGRIYTERNRILGTWTRQDNSGTYLYRFDKDGRYAEENPWCRVSAPYRIEGWLPPKLVMTTISISAVGDVSYPELTYDMSFQGEIMSLGGHGQDVEKWTTIPAEQFQWRPSYPGTGVHFVLRPDAAPPIQK